MSALTTTLKMLKKSPTTDGADVFNLDTILNDNWDKLDAAVGARSGVCGDAAGSTAKAVTIAGYVLLTGVPVAVSFTNGSSAAALTLNISSTGAKRVECRGSATLTAAMIPSGHLAQLIYDGSAYWLINPADLANVVHTHAQSDVTGLGTALAAKQDTTLSLPTGNTPADADYVPFYDVSETGNKKTLWGDVKAALKTYFNTFYAALSHTHTKSQITDFPTTMTPTTHAASHATGGTDALTPANIGAATKYSGTATLTVAGWTGTAAPFTQAVTCAGILATDTPTVDCVTGTDAAAGAAIVEAWGLAVGGGVNPQTGAGTITFYASDKPAVAIPFRWEGTR